VTNALEVVGFAGFR